jgi:antitoxin component YwqK of YwqJK toxin-antitoxin module
MMKIILSLITFTVIFFSCTQQKDNSKNINSTWLDSIITSSDSSYTKPYYRSDFVTAEYYLNKNDATVCQLMKDSAGKIRQIVITKKEVRTFFGQYYSNGQLQASLPLDAFGQYHGASTYYYKSGSVKSSGNYVHGFKNGTWENYNENSKLLFTEEFDSNGGLIKTIPH